MVDDGAADDAFTREVLELYRVGNQLVVVPDGELMDDEKPTGRPGGVANDQRRRADARTQRHVGPSSLVPDRRPDGSVVDTQRRPAIWRWLRGNVSIP
jgi:hypothetical protein